MEKNKDKYEIITLGGNCGPRTLLTTWNLIPTKAKGRLSLPFDLSIHKISIVAQQIKEDFENYLKGIRYGYKSGNRYYWTNFNDEVIYYHDFINIPDIRKIESRYTARINNFRKLSKETDYVFYLVNCLEDTTAQDLNELYEALKSFREKPFKLLAWQGANIDSTQINPEIKVLYKRGPAQNGLSAWDKNREIPQEEIDYKNALKQFVIDNIKEEGFEVQYFELALKDKLKHYIKYDLPKAFTITNNWVDNRKMLVLFGKKFNLWKLPED